jgi:hypothetical protein
MVDELTAVPAPPPERRAVGRPRKWASEAERKRAYRERLAAELDEPLTLRRELRTERRRSAGFQQENRRLRAELIAAQARTDEAEQVAEDLRIRIEWLATKAEADRRQASEALAEVRELQTELNRLHSTKRLPAPIPTPFGPQPRTQHRRCESAGCQLPAVSRLQGPRGVERDACDLHQPSGRQMRCWRVIHRY